MEPVDSGPEKGHALLKVPGLDSATGFCDLDGRVGSLHPVREAVTREDAD